MEYKVKTMFNKNQIIQESGFDDLRADIVRKVIDLQDAGVRDALIKLGWTPPKE